MTDVQAPKIGWRTYVLAIVWAAFLVGMGRVVPRFGALFTESGFVLPLTSRVVVGIPPAVWFALGVLGSGALVWKSKLLPVKRAELIDWVAAWALVAVAIAVVIALFGPLIVNMR